MNTKKVELMIGKLDESMRAYGCAVANSGLPVAARLVLLTRQVLVLHPKVEEVSLEMLVKETKLPEEEVVKNLKLCIDRGWLHYGALPDYQPAEAA